MVVVDDVGPIHRGGAKHWAEFLMLTMALGIPVVLTSRCAELATTICGAVVPGSTLNCVCFTFGDSPGVQAVLRAGEEVETIKPLEPPYKQRKLRDQSVALSAESKAVLHLLEDLPPECVECFSILSLLRVWWPALPNLQSALTSLECTPLVAVSFAVTEDGRRLKVYNVPTHVRTAYCGTLHNGSALHIQILGLYKQSLAVHTCSFLQEATEMSSPFISDHALGSTGNRLSYHTVMTAQNVTFPHMSENNLLAEMLWHAVLADDFHNALSIYYTLDRFLYQVTDRERYVQSFLAQLTLLGQIPTQLGLRRARILKNQGLFHMAWEILHSYERQADLRSGYVASQVDAELYIALEYYVEAKQLLDIAFLEESDKGKSKVLGLYGDILKAERLVHEAAEKYHAGAELLNSQSEPVWILLFAEGEYLCRASLGSSDAVEALFQHFQSQFAQVPSSKQQKQLFRRARVLLCKGLLLKQRGDDNTRLFLEAAAVNYHQFLSNLLEAPVETFTHAAMLPSTCLPVRPTGSENSTPSSQQKEQHFASSGPPANSKSDSATVLPGTAGHTAAAGSPTVPLDDSATLPPCESDSATVPPASAYSSQPTVPPDTSATLPPNAAKSQPKVLPDAPATLHAAASLTPATCKERPAALTDVSKRPPVRNADIDLQWCSLPLHQDIHLALKYQFCEEDGQWHSDFLSWTLLQLKPSAHTFEGSFRTAFEARCLDDPDSFVVVKCFKNCSNNFEDYIQVHRRFVFRWSFGIM
eukprot:TRINITY_DN1568_c0_g1_i3.p1 TRINITY_DN1568_c0_g1~~TRINITY_DN1568_c0_g1_i3.p1  ORF type:complete len:880 (-),score=166.72 TRINITY_DN1568_c0_g1_i3:527-2800(-)